MFCSTAWGFDAIDELCAAPALRLLDGVGLLLIMC